MPNADICLGSEEEPFLAQAPRAKRVLPITPEERRRASAARKMPLFRHDQAREFGILGKVRVSAAVIARLRPERAPLPAMRPYHHRPL